MRAFIYATEADGQSVDLRGLIAYARSRLPTALIKGVWIDERDDASIPRRRGGGELLDRTRRRGDHLIVPTVGTLAHPIRDLTDTVRNLVEWKRLTVHFVSHGFVYGPGGDAERMNELAEQAYREWRVRRTREGVACWKAEGGRVTGWAPYGERIVCRNGKRTTEGCWWERAWIAKCIEWREAGMTYPAIVAELRKRKAKTSRGTEWNCVRVRRAVEASQSAEVASVRTTAGVAHSDENREQRLCKPVTTPKPARKRTSKRPQSFTVDGIRVKKYPKPTRTIAETRQEYRDVIRIMRAICQSAGLRRRLITFRVL